MTFALYDYRDPSFYPRALTMSFDPFSASPADHSALSGDAAGTNTTNWNTHVKLAVSCAPSVALATSGGTILFVTWRKHT